MKDEQTKLQNFLATSAKSKTAQITGFYKLTAGAIQENWAIDLNFSGGPLAGRQELCLRTNAPTSIASSHSRKEEFHLLQLAFQNGIKVPEPLFFCDDENVMGQPFFIMRRIKGSANPRLLTRQIRAQNDRNKLLNQIGAELAKIHQIQPDQTKLKFLNKPDQIPSHYVIKEYKKGLDRLNQPRPALEWGLRWAELHHPVSHRQTLCHRDFRIGNLMVESNNLIGVLDWEFSDWSDPMEDVGWFCAKCWRFGKNLDEAGGIGSRDSFYRGYETESGTIIERNHIFFWEVIAHIRWAIIALQQGERFTKSGELSIETPMTAFIAAQLEWEVLQMTQRW